MTLVELANIRSARLPFWQHHTVFDATWNYLYLILPHQNLAKFCHDIYGSKLWNNESLAIQTTKNRLLIHIFVYI